MDRKFEGGGTEQFTFTSSVQANSTPVFFIKNWAETLVYSGPAATSGDGYYYKFAPIPSSRGEYTDNWYYSINANSFIKSGRFEVVQTLAIETPGLYCGANDVINLYDPLRTAKLTNNEIDTFIRDIMAQVNLKLAPVFTVSSLSGNPVIHVITKNLTLTDILERKGKEVPQWVTDRRTKYEGILDALALGSMYLVTSGGDLLIQTLASGISQVEHSMEDYTPTFNMLDLEYQRIDPDRIDDEEDAL
uniref:Uncharacterized protein n=1 Tax=viral metagenome TaxID=1070528 RepID=A0A6H1ZFV6_9ZZZZ